MRDYHVIMHLLTLYPFNKNLLFVDKLSRQYLLNYVSTLELSLLCSGVTLFRGLERLILRSAVNISVLKQLNLTELDIGYTELPLDFFNYLSPELVVLNVCCTNLVDFVRLENEIKYLNGLEHLVNLTSLDVSGCYLEDYFFEMLKEMSKLKYLNLSENAFRKINIPEKNELEHLDISRCVDLEGSAVKNVCHKFKNLKFLNLGRCKLSNNSFEYIKNLTSLTYLNLDSLQINDDPFFEISMLKETLTYLDVSRCEGISDLSIANIGLLHKLETLLLPECHITDEGAVYLEGLFSLKTLVMYSCRYITDTAMDSISLLTNITNLDIQSIYITDNGLLSLANMTHLYYLNISGCTSITDNGLNQLSHLPYLSTVVIRGCPRIQHQHPFNTVEA